MKKIYIILFFIIAICILFFVVNKDSKNKYNKNTNNTIDKSQNIIIDEDGGVYTVIVNNEVKYFGSDAVQAEIYSEDPEFDLKMPDFDNLE